jgi:hypothetical protein
MPGPPPHGRRRHGPSRPHERRPRSVQPKTRTAQSATRDPGRFSAGPRPPTLGPSPPRRSGFQGSSEDALRRLEAVPMNLVLSIANPNHPTPEFSNDPLGPFAHRPPLYYRPPTTSLNRCSTGQPPGLASPSPRPGLVPKLSSPRLCNSRLAPTPPSSFAANNSSAVNLPRTPKSKIVHTLGHVLELQGRDRLNPRSTQKLQSQAEPNAKPMPKLPGQADHSPELPPRHRRQEDLTPQPPLPHQNPRFTWPKPPHSHLTAPTTSKAWDYVYIEPRFTGDNDDQSTFVSLLASCRA